MRVLFALIGLCGGCLAGSLQARVGPAVDGDGRVSIQAGFGAAFGMSQPGGSVQMFHSVMGGGTANHLESTQGAEHLAVGRQLGYRAGVEVTAPLYGDTTSLQAMGGMVWVLSSRLRSSGHPDHGPYSTSRRSWLVGVRARAGVSWVDVGEGGASEVQRRGTVGLDLTLDWLTWSRVRFSASTARPGPPPPAPRPAAAAAAGQARW